MELQTCPSRMNQIGPWPREPNLDQWLTDRWLVDPEAVRAKHDAEDAIRLKEHNAIQNRIGRPEITLEEFRAKHFIRGDSNDLWKWSWGPPRTCDFCGGIHPDDAIKLIEEGWEVEPTGKNYKRYLNPPGSAVRHMAVIASLQDPKREPFEGVPSIWTPTPPVKLYVAHFEQSHVDAFNAILEKRKKESS